MKKLYADSMYRNLHNITHVTKHIIHQFWQSITGIEHEFTSQDKAMFFVEMIKNTNKLLGTESKKN